MLPIGDCYISDDWQHAGEAIVWVTRCHPQGTYTVGTYFVDTFCLGVPYEEAHNLIYGAVAFAEEGALVANRQPERRGEVIEWFRKVLQFYAPRLEHQECCDGFPIK